MNKKPVRIMTKMISVSDYKTITNAIEESNQNATKAVLELKEIIASFEVVDDALLPPNVVKLNSTIDLETPFGAMKTQIVLPESSNSRQKRISIFTPMAYTILGNKIGDKVQILFPNGEQEVTITSVMNEL